MPATETRPAHLAKNATVRRATWTTATATVVRFKAATKSTAAAVLVRYDDQEPAPWGPAEHWFPASEMVAA
jgi:hypothetical protein